MTIPPEPSGMPAQEYRLRVHPQRSDAPWQAELRDLAAPSDAPPLTFDTPLELARHLARSGTPGPGLR